MARTFELVVGGILLLLLGLSALARRYPEVAWLQAFRDAFPRLPEKERARMRRRANVYAGVEMILMGLALPLGYLFLTVMFFNAFTPLKTTLVLAASVLLIGLGCTAIWRSRR